MLVFLTKLVIEAKEMVDECIDVIVMIVNKYLQSCGYGCNQNEEQHKCYFGCSKASVIQGYKNAQKSHADPKYYSRKYERFPEFPFVDHIAFR